MLSLLQGRTIVWSLNNKSNQITVTHCQFVLPNFTVRLLLPTHLKNGFLKSLPTPPTPIIWQQSEPLENIDEISNECQEGGKS